MVRLKRAYELADAEDGYRILVERLWPRGLRKEEAHFDEWLKDVAPSDSLRKWFHHDPSRWAEFEQRYLRELDTEAARARIDDLVRRARSETVTLVYSAHDEQHNNAVVLERVIASRVRRAPRKITRPTKRHAPARVPAHAAHARR